MPWSLPSFAAVRPFVASLVLSSLAAVAVAADSARASASAAAGTGTLPVISITEVDARDAGVYAAQVAAINAVMKEQFKVDPFLRLYLGDAAGDEYGALFAVSRGDSFASLMKSAQIYQGDPALAELRAGLAPIREIRSRMLLKAVRFDGANAQAVLYNTYVVVTDEPGYLNALAQLRALCDDHDLSDVKINAYRIIAGRSDATHLVSLNAASTERLAALLDAIASEAWAIDWVAASAKFRTVVRNGTYREISR